jgi:hypothetical protein
MKTVYVAFQNRATDQVGNEGASIRLYRPSTWNFDAALWRAFPLRQKLTMDFRLQAPNLFIHTRLNKPNTAINHNNFGKITSSQDPRILQEALKLNF